MASFTKLNKTAEQGVFSQHPSMSPKYNRQQGHRDAEFRDTLARMFVSIEGGTTAREDFLNSIGDVNNTTRQIAERLIGSGDPSQANSAGYIDFFLQRVDEQFTEKMQVNEVLADNYVSFFFGQAPPIFSYQGTLINSFQDDQRTSMFMAYQALLRGTQLARRKAILRLRYDSVIVTGVMMNMTQTLNADNEMAIPFSFQLLVKEYFIFQEPAVITTKVTDPFVPAGVSFNNAVISPTTVPVKLVFIRPTPGVDAPKSVVEQVPSVDEIPPSLLPSTQSPFSLPDRSANSENQVSVLTVPTRKGALGPKG